MNLDGPPDYNAAFAARDLAAAVERVRAAPIARLRQSLRQEAEGLAVGPLGTGATDLDRIRDALVRAAVSNPNQGVAPILEPEALKRVNAALNKGLLSVGTGEDQGETWESPVPFDDGGELPPFPTDALPEVVGEWVRAEAVATQTPEDLAAIVALGAISTACAKKYRVEVRPGWIEPINLYLAVALQSGNRKSAVFRDAAEPVREWERESAEREAPALRIAADALEIAEGRLGDAKARAIKAKAEERLVMDEDVRQRGEEVAALPRPVAVRLLADDVTPERMIGILAEQGGRLAVLSPEGGLFDLLAGRYTANGAPNIDAFLKMHAGDGLRVDRVGRPAEQVREPALTVGLAVQPEVIRGLADRPGFRGRGLIARFLFGVPKSTVGVRLVDAPTVPEGIVRAYRTMIRTLLELPAERGEDGEIEALPVRFTPEAVRSLLAFSGELEPRLGEGGDLAAYADWGAKLPGAVARVAGLFALADCGGSGNCGSLPEIPADTVERAVEVGRYLIPHALSAFGLMGARPEVEDARFVLRWITRSSLERFTVRDAWQGTRGRFDRADDLALPLGELEGRGFIRLEPAEPRAGPGRPRSPVYSVNPLAPSHNPHSPRKSQERQGSGSPAPVPTVPCRPTTDGAGFLPTATAEDRKSLQDLGPTPTVGDGPPPREGGTGRNKPGDDRPSRGARGRP